MSATGINRIIRLLYFARPKLRLIEPAASEPALYTVAQSPLSRLGLAVATPLPLDQNANSVRFGLVGAKAQFTHMLAFGCAKSTNKAATRLSALGHARLDVIELDVVGVVGLDVGGETVESALDGLLGGAVHHAGLEGSVLRIWYREW